MSDIAKELRERSLLAEQEGEPLALLDEAADEIERLRVNLRLADAGFAFGPPTLTDEEREAIKMAIMRERGEWYGTLDYIRAATLQVLLERTK
jgi:hypothetical protein